MTDAQIQTLVAEYKRLEKLLEREQARADSRSVEIRYLESRMASIETKFQQADVLWELLCMSQDTLPFSELAPERPRVITTETGAEFLRLCDRQDRGELEILSVSRGVGAQWTVEVWYPKCQP
jgi:hypothetical protein